MARPVAQNVPAAVSQRSAQTQALSAVRRDSMAEIWRPSEGGPAGGLPLCGSSGNAGRPLLPGGPEQGTGPEPPAAVDATTLAPSLGARRPDPTGSPHRDRRGRSRQGAFRDSEGRAGRLGRAPAEVRQGRAGPGRR